MRESLVLLLDSPLHATSCFIVIRKQFCAMWRLAKREAGKILPN